MNLLFDLDGTLTDPRLGIVGCIEYALTRLGRDPALFPNLERCIGPPLLDSFSDLLGNITEAYSAVEYYRERFSVKGMYENKVYDGIEQCLGTLAESGHRLMIATSKPVIYAEKIVDHFHLRPYFERVYGSELDGTRTDKSDLIRFVLTQESLDPTQTMMIGDRSHDIVGAVANSIQSIGVLWGYGSPQELSEAGAGSLCHSPLNLIDCIA